MSVFTLSAAFIRKLILLPILTEFSCEQSSLAVESWCTYRPVLFFWYEGAESPADGPQ